MSLPQIGRFELKYVISRKQRAEIIKDLADYMQPDSMGDDTGRYVVTSLYYDSADYRCYWAKINGHRYRRKLRIRIYDTHVITPQAPCNVEVKTRINQAVQKRRLVLPYTEAAALCGAGETPDLASLPEDQRAIIDGIGQLHTMLKLREACVVGYHRTAMMTGDKDRRLRVTFDTDLTCRGHELTLLSSRPSSNHALFPSDVCIMEIKLPGTTPIWLSQLLAFHRCELRRVSKYCTSVEVCRSPLGKTVHAL